MRFDLYFLSHFLKDHPNWRYLPGYDKSLKI